jgi:hypothetical protein
MRSETASNATYTASAAMNSAMFVRHLTNPGVPCPAHFQPFRQTLLDGLPTAEPFAVKLSLNLSVWPECAIALVGVARSRGWQHPPASGAMLAAWRSRFPEPMIVGHGTFFRPARDHAAAIQREVEELPSAALAPHQLDAAFYAATTPDDALDEARGGMDRPSLALSGFGRYWSDQ